jgi:hypothetical protein
MAKCDECGREMTDPKTTTCDVIPFVFPDGHKLDQIPWDGLGRCGDCQVEQGGMHHSGCDKEKCPRCLGQAISCSCFDAYYDALASESI